VTRKFVNVLKVKNTLINILKVKNTLINLGWSGSSCNQCSSDIFCNGHGSCSLLSGKCNCNRGWEGERCNIPHCNNIPSYKKNVCSGRGKCVDYNVCNCTNEYSGKDCQNNLCFGRESIDPYVCSGKFNLIQEMETVVYRINVNVCMDMLVWFVISPHAMEKIIVRVYSF
jgi:hypothetical protein